MRKYRKALTFSYDDGIEQDRKLVEIFNKYGMKATFNLNTGIQTPESNFEIEGVYINRMKQEGLEELKQRLDYLIVYLREDVAKKLQHARELGDLSENAEYDAAKQEESQVASEIKELEERIKNAVIIEKSGNHKVSIGNVITVEYLGELDDEDDRVMTVQLVGETEADFAKGKISNESLLGKALLGKKSGEIVRFSTAHGDEEYKVVNIK